MRTYLVEVECLSLATLAFGHASLSLPIPGSPTRCEISDTGRRQGQSAVLRLRIEVNAETREGAEAAAAQKSKTILTIASFVTSQHFSDIRCVRMTDWTSHIAKREDFVILYAPSDEDVSESLDTTILASVEQLLAHDYPESVRTALEWFNKGLEADTPQAKFQCFWLALETLGTESNTGEKVPDRCAKCQSPLYCEKCKAHPTHAPYRGQKIKQLVDNALGTQGLNVFDKAQKIRHATFHGGDFLTKQEQGSLEIVHELGRTAHACILHRLRQAPLKNDFHLQMRKNYGKQYYRCDVRAEIELPLYEGVPSVADLPSHNLEIVRTGAKYEVRQKSS